MLLRLGLRAASWPPSPRLGFAIHTKKTIAAHYDAPMTPQRRACPVADKKHDQHGNEYTDAPFRRAADGDIKPCKAENGGDDGCNRASSTHFAAGSTRSASSKMTWRSVSRARDSSCSWNPVHERVANPRMRITLSRSDRILSARPAVLAMWRAVSRRRWAPWRPTHLTSSFVRSRTLGCFEIQARTLS